MIHKYEDLPDYDRNGNRTTTLLSVGGLHKHASYDGMGGDIKDFITTIKPREGFAYLLVSALGDQNWGPNRNGDYWPTKGLKNPTSEFGYKTFQLNGHWYHHHVNKDPSKAYGKVIYSVWNDMMGRVELIVEVDLEKDKETADDLRNGRVIKTSMGSSVSSDICLICHPNYDEFYKIPEEDMVRLSLTTSLSEVHEIGKKHGVDLSYITKMNERQAIEIPVLCAETREVITEDGERKTIPSPNMRKIPVFEYDNIMEAETVREIHAIGRKYGVDLTFINQPHPKITVKEPKPQMPWDKDKPKETPMPIRISQPGGPVGIHSDNLKYCDHMSKMNGKILPDGRLVCVANLRPKFYDISKVTFNAERSSFVLAKVASDESQCKDTHKYAVENKEADIEKTVMGDVIGEGLDDIQKYYVQEICPALLEREKELPDDIIDGMASKHSLPEILSTFLGMGMTPHPREFQRIVLIQMGKKDLADEYDKRGISLNYDNLSEQVLPMLGNMEDVTPIDMGAEYINGDIIKQLEPHFWDRSAYRQPVVKRMIIIKQAEESGIQLPENKYIIPKEELKRPELLPPLLASVGTMMLITMFSQAKNKTRDIVTAMTKHKYLLGAAVAGAIVANSMLKSNAAEYGSMIGKTAAVTTTNAASVPQDLTGMQQAWKAMKWGGPALLVYGTGGHVINKVQRGEKINPVEKFVTQHPIISAVGATVAVNKPKLITDLTKRFYKMFKKAEEMGLEGFNIDDYPVEDRDAIAAYIWTKNKT